MFSGSENEFQILFKHFLTNQKILRKNNKQGSFYFLNIRKTDQVNKSMNKIISFYYQLLLMKPYNLWKKPRPSVVDYIEDESF